MDKIALVVLVKVYDNFTETQECIDKAYVEECCKEKISVDEVFFTINNDVMLLCFSKD